MPDATAGSDVDEQRVDLDERARPIRLQAPGQAAGIALVEAEAEAAAARPAAQDRHGRDNAAPHQLGEDAADR